MKATERAHKIMFHWISIALKRLRARSIGLIRSRRTPPFWDDTSNSAHLNPDESSELVSSSSEKNTHEFD